jgi:hypothetical protein
MHVNGYVQHVDDTIPEVLAELVEDAQVEIYNQMDTLTTYEGQFLDSSKSLVRPTILIARMAIIANIGDILTMEAITSPTHIFTHYKSLQGTYIPYWMYLARGTFLPEVQRLGPRGDIPDSVWLGVRSRK